VSREFVSLRWCFFLLLRFLGAIDLCRDFSSRTSTYVRRVVQSCRFNDHINDSREASPCRDVEGRPAALFALLDISTCRQEQLANFCVTHFGGDVNRRLQPLRGQRNNETATPPQHECLTALRLFRSAPLPIRISTVSRTFAWQARCKDVLPFWKGRTFQLSAGGRVGSTLDLFGLCH
jgi:hypothetical protein